MSSAEITTNKGVPAVRQPASVAIYAIALFSSALLMFLVQPMFARMALPRLGGSASVWSLALVFFQGVLLLGYAYAHLLVKLVSLRQATVIHVAVMVAALASLPVGISAAWSQPPESGEALWLLGLFATSIGLPFFAISANAPLLQAWFSRSGHAKSHDPYFLYAASNAGSFAALMAYPLVIEPVLGLLPQSRLWTAGYVALIVMVAGCGWLAAAAVPASATSDGGARATERPAWATLIKWVALSFVPSGLLVGVTAHIATDLVSAPFMWVVPLALYLLTFVIAFQSKPFIAHEQVIRWLGLLAAPLCLFTLSPATNLWLVPLHLFVVFWLMLASHGELARLRPAAGHLTGFYFLMSLGGVMGGSFASLAAPVLFKDVLEYPLLLAAGFAVIGLVRPPHPAMRIAAAAATFAIPAALLLSWIARDAPTDGRQSLLLAWMLASLAALLLFSRKPLAQGAILFAVMLIYETVSHGPPPILQSRSFYGALAVYPVQQGRIHMLSHGTTKHGSQVWLDDNGLRIAANPEPQSYYYLNGPFGSLFRHLRASEALQDVGVVGLGTGSMACHAGPGERWSFFEIDPQVVRVAGDPSLFTYLRDCAPGARIILGDGRLKLAAEPAASYDLIVLDAFSSDSVPAHLMTLEALDTYLARLKPGGTVVFHISNRFMELSGVIEAAARRRGLAVFYNSLDNRYWKPDRARLDLRPHLAVITTSAVTRDGLAADPAWHRAGPGDIPTAWTDDYSNTAGAIWRKLAGAKPY
jgi:hypothetical protein